MKLRNVAVSRTGQYMSAALPRGLLVLCVVLLSIPDAVPCVCVGPSLQMVLDRYRFVAKVRVVGANEAVVTSVYLGALRAGGRIRLLGAPGRDPLDIAWDCCDEKSERGQIGKEYILAIEEMSSRRFGPKVARMYGLLRTRDRVG